ncbi:hypothetical protein GGS26DRAFT_382249 [Hypomontagnella submonticulosa]|nr:hypothetical protein GGS26DRAFT_382249 [Hypomontagnella submonticulosa]
MVPYSRAFHKLRPPFDPYKVLHVERNASLARIRQSYHELTEIHHPHVAGKRSIPIWFEMVEAFDLLSDPEYKKWYDTWHEPPDRTKEYEAHYYRRKTWALLCDIKLQAHEHRTANAQTEADATASTATASTASASTATGMTFADLQPPPTEAQENPPKKTEGIFRSREWVNKAAGRATEDLQALESGVDALQKRIHALTQNSDSLRPLVSRVVFDVRAKKKSIEYITTQTAEAAQWKDGLETRDVIARLYRAEEKIVPMEKSLRTLEDLVGKLEAAEDIEEKRRLKKLVRAEASLWGLDKEQRSR